ncbi:MAG: hypothetical protein EXQ89_03535 [Rhodospirillaceae bacterium]|nr:hypothetical protein [Rhodospirillaceae bacterium]
MTRRKLAALTAVVWIGLSAGAFAQVLVMNEPVGPLRAFGTETAGIVPADPRGITLYTYDADTAGKPTCSGACAQTWPPFLVADPSLPHDSYDGVRRDNVGIIAREDGKKQRTFNDMPLYYHDKDTNPGDATGNKVGNVWSVVNLPGFFE